jgi:hypothetical protein
MLAHSELDGAIHVRGRRNEALAVADGEAGWLERSEFGGAYTAGF